jgi:hypothetical protein
MATLTVQELPRFGAALGGLTFAAADVAGDEYQATGRELVLVKGATGWTSETAQVEGVPSQDSARDGTSVLDPGAINDVDIAGPFRPNNWNNGGVVQITYPGGVTGLEIAIVRFTTG